MAGLCEIVNDAFVFACCALFGEVYFGAVGLHSAEQRVRSSEVVYGGTGHFVWSWISADLNLLS